MAQAQETTQHTESPSGIAALGINGQLFAAQLLHFVIILVIFWKWVYKPLVAMLDKRANTIEKSLADAKRIDERLTALEKERTDILADARVEAGSIVAESRAQAVTLQERLMQKTKEDVDQIVKAGKQRLEQEKQTMIVSAKNDIATLVVGATKQILEEKMTENVSQREAEELISRLTTV